MCVDRRSIELSAGQGQFTTGCGDAKAVALAPAGIHQPPEFGEPRNDFLAFQACRAGFTRMDSAGRRWEPAPRSPTIPQALVKGRRTGGWKRSGLREKAQAMTKPLHRKRGIPIH